MCSSDLPIWELPTNPILKGLDVPLGPWAIDSSNGAEYQPESEITFLIFKGLFGNIVCNFWKYVWMKKYVKIHVILFKN